MTMSREYSIDSLIQRRFSDDDLNETDGEQRLPVFVFPASIDFYFNDHTSLKQVLTIYNPYDFAVKYKVLSTSPIKYKVTEPSGTIRPRSCLDITIRLEQNSYPTSPHKDKFRIQMRRENCPSQRGHRDVEATYSSAKESIWDSTVTSFDEITSTTPSTRPRPVESGDMTVPPTTNGSQLTHINRDGQIPILLYFLVAVCLAIICLPNNGENIDSLLPNYLHVSETPKIVAGFFLGVITTIICRNV